VWFVYVAVGLVLLVVSGLYARRRITEALSQVGVRPRGVRIMRWAMVWLLYGYPILIILSVVISLLLGRATTPRLDGRLAAWLLGIPFAWSVLAVVQATPWLIAIDLAYLVARRRRDAARVARLRAAAVLVAVAAFALYTPARILAQRGDLRIRHHELGPPAGAPAFRIAFLSDVHHDVHTDADRAREVFAEVNASKPDIVLSGGDWISTGPDYIESAATVAATLTSRLGTFSVRGDHEHFAYVDRERSVTEVLRAMRAHGIVMASNEVRWLEHCGKRIAVVLLNHNYVHRTDRATIEALIASTAGADYSIVVTHQLDGRLAALLENKVNLVLVGHTHGGQVNPVLGLVHVNLARLETTFVDGRYQQGATTIIVTAGIGYSIVPIRYAAPGSIELIDLRLCGGPARPAARAGVDPPR
jgi:predicted MPP superfamily phosphohydrolase